MRSQGGYGCKYSKMGSQGEFFIDNDHNNSTFYLLRSCIYILLLRVNICLASLYEPMNIVRCSYSVLKIQCKYYWRYLSFRFRLQMLKQLSQCLACKTVKDIQCFNLQTCTTLELSIS